MWKESLQLYKSVKKEQLHLMNSEKVTGWTDEQEIHKAEVPNSCMGLFIWCYHMCIINTI